MRVRAAVLREMGLAPPYAASRPLEVTELELRPPGPGELLVRVRAAGLCHSDLSVINGSRPRVMPMVLGHEASGEVVALGPGTVGFAEGDHVVLAFVPSCGECEACRRGRGWLCGPGGQANAVGSLLGGGRPFTAADGTALHHHLGVSGFADHTVVSARSAVRIDPDLPFEVAALFSCAVLTGVGAALNSARVQPGDRVAVLGLGGVGLAAVLGAAVAGASVLVAVDRIPAKLELARQLGATHAFLASDDVVGEVRGVTDGGADQAIETVGDERVLAQAYAATRPGGTTVTVGLPDPSRMLSIPAVSLVTEERTLRGSYLGSGLPAEEVPRYIAMYRAGRLPVERLLSHTLALDDINAAFDRLAAADAVRQTVLFAG